MQSEASLLEELPGVCDGLVRDGQAIHSLGRDTAAQSVEGRAREKSGHRLAFVRSQAPTEGPDGRWATGSQGQAYSLKPTE